MIRKRVCVIFIHLVGILAGIAGIIRMMQKEIVKAQTIAYKNEAIIQLFNQWLIVKNSGRSIGGALKESGYHNVAIYGMGYIGERLLDELEDSDINVKYGIDQNAKYIGAKIDVVMPEDELPEVDVVLVTAVYSFDEIEKKLSKKMKCPILSFGDILYEI